MPSPEQTTRLVKGIARRQEIPIMKFAFGMLAKPENEKLLQGNLICISDAID